ncbi:hypothetical protein ACFL4B_01575 [Candidatus Neomarinimicrobiota bacterium]
MKKLFIANLMAISLIFANEELLLQTIKENIHVEKGWENIEEFDSGISVSVKDIPDIPIKAIMVKQNIAIDADIIAEVVEDVANYGKFLNSASAMDANLLYKNEQGLFGHQHFDLKYVKDRHYAFNMFKPFGNTNRVDWELIPEKTFDSINESKNVNKKGVYIDIGYGSWLVNKLENGEAEISYRLVMHPGGSVPNFAIDYINKVAIVALFEDAIDEALKRSDRSNN